MIFNRSFLGFCDITVTSVGGIVLLCPIITVWGVLSAVIISLHLIIGKFMSGSVVYQLARSKYGWGQLRLALPNLVHCVPRSVGHSSIVLNISQSHNVVRFSTIMPFVRMYDGSVG